MQSIHPQHLLKNMMEYILHHLSLSFCPPVLLENIHGFIASPLRHTLPIPSHGQKHSSNNSFAIIIVSPHFLNKSSFHQFILYPLCRSSAFKLSCSLYNKSNYFYFSCLYLSFTFHSVETLV